MQILKTGINSPINPLLDKLNKIIFFDHRLLEFLFQRLRIIPLFLSEPFIFLFFAFRFFLHVRKQDLDREC